MISRFLIATALAAFPFVGASELAPQKVTVDQPIGPVIRVVHGPELAPYLEEVVNLYNKVYGEYPYFYDGTDPEVEEFLRAYGEEPNAIAVLAFDGQQLVGIATGMPMSDFRPHYQEPFVDAGRSIDSLFYLGDLLILSHYRSPAFAEKLYLALEHEVQLDGRFSSICVAQIEEANVSGEKPEGFISDEVLYAKQGFVRQPELQFMSVWRNIGDTKDSDHLMTYWTKNFS